MDWFSYKNHLAIYKETDTHPGIKTEKPDLFFSVNFESTEIDYLDFLYGLVVVKKPKFILETGTNIGISTVAFAFALKSNAEHGIKGHLYTIDKDGSVVAIAKERIGQVDLRDYVSFIVQDSLDRPSPAAGVGSLFNCYWPGCQPPSGVSCICFESSKAVDRSLSFSTSTRPSTSTELFGEGICVNPVGACPFHRGPVMR